MQKRELMQDFINILVLFIVGGIGGILAGMLGVGGGIVFVLIMSHYLSAIGVPSHQLVPAIVANSMFAMFFAGLSGTIKQWKQNYFFPKEILFTSIPSSIASIFFSYLIGLGNWYTKEKFTIVFILLLAFLGYKIFRGKEEEHGIQTENLSVYKFMLIGFLAGIIASFSGIGGGILMVPFFSHFMGISIKKATAISLGAIMMMAFFTSLFNLFFIHAQGLNIPYSYGNIAFAVAIPTALGSMVGSPMGVNLAHRMSPRSTRLIFVLFVIIVIVKMILGIIW